MKPTKASTSGKAGEPKTAAGTSHNALKVVAEPGIDQASMLANVALRPSVRAAVTVQAFAKPALGQLDLTALVDELSMQVDAVTKGNLQRAEAMLIAQAHVLESLFYELARRAGLNMGEHLQAAETYMRLALKSQGQCRTTLETLAAIKNPPHLAFVKQANIGQAVQVNNGTGVADANQAFSDQYARARTESEPNKLLEHSDGKRLDLGAPAATGSADSALETLGKVDRSAHIVR